MNPDSTPSTNKSVKDGPVLRDHTFDGIQEFDQKLPNWWLFTLYIAIVLYIVYWVVYYSTDMIKTPTEKVNALITSIENVKNKELADSRSSLDDAKLFEMSKDAAILAEGKASYSQICIACHGPDLKGTAIGRSLINDKWEHGGKPMDLYTLILEGSPKGSPGLNGQLMTPWKDVLGPKKIAKVVAFIISKNPHLKP